MPKFTLEKRQYLQQLVLRNLIDVCRKNKVETLFSALTNTNPKLIKDQSTMPYAEKLLKEKAGNVLQGTVKDLMNWLPIVYEVRPVIGKWDLIKIKTFEQQWKLSFK